MRILIVGAGAVGGYFGARWIAAGRDVTFLVREGRRVALANAGLTVRGVSQNLSVEPRAITTVPPGEQANLVFLAVAGGALSDVIEKIAPAIGPETSIVSALNGVRHFDRLRDVFGPTRVLGSVVKCATKLEQDESIVELAPLAHISVGDWLGGDVGRLQNVHAALAVKGIEVHVSFGIREEIFEKWLLMITLGAANCLLNGDVAAINAEPRGAWVIQEILNEGKRGLDEIGMRPRDAAVETMAGLLAEPGSHQTSSLYRNMMAGQPIELEPIIGDFLDRLPDHRSYPLLCAAYARLSVYSRCQRT